MRLERHAVLRDHPDAQPQRRIEREPELGHEARQIVSEGEAVSHEEDALRGVLDAGESLEAILSGDGGGRDEVQERRERGEGAHRGPSARSSGR
jgi:hypothetical protein